MLTDLQKEHLQSMKTDISRSRDSSAEIKKKEAASKNVSYEKYEGYLDKVQSDVDQILLTGIYPLELERAHEIHDFLEKNRNDI